jgi:hypothetical protein
MKKSDRFETLEAYQESASKTAKQVAYNRKVNRLLQYYGFKRKFEGYEYPADEMLQYDIDRFRSWFVNECDCPITLMATWMDAIYEADRDMTVNGIIAREMGYTTEASFVRFGDRNCLDKQIRRNYISEKGLPLDIMAMQMSNQGIEITEQMIIDFICQYPKGKQYWEGYQYIIDLENAFKSKVGFIPSQEFVRNFLSDLAERMNKFRELDDCPF